ncbi:unnamed protein product, partial [marine sediment metagenome]
DHEGEDGKRKHDMSSRVTSHDDHHFLDMHTSLGDCWKKSNHKND